MLTRKQLNLLQYIEEKTSKNSVSPSFEEMKEALNLKSKSGIHRLILALEERGFIRRLPHRARALEVIKKIDKTDLGNIAHDRKAPSVQVAFSLPETKGLGKIPHLGRIAAGAPIEAISDMANEINVPPSMIGQGQHFALEVKGESMIEAGINDGDIVVIKEQNQANNGDIVVALIDDQEATLKKLNKKGSLIELEAANPNFQKQVYESSKVTIQGKLVGLLRTY